MVLRKKVNVALLITPILFSCHSKVDENEIVGKWDCQFVPIYGSHKGTADGTVIFERDGKFNSTLNVIADKKNPDHGAIVKENGTFTVNKSIIYFDILKSNISPTDGIDNSKLIDNLKEGFFAPSTSEFDLIKLDDKTLRMRQGENDSEYKCNKQR